MTGPRNVTFPRPNPNLNNTECSAASLRPAESSLAVACPVCGHMACRVYTYEDPPGTVHEQPCEVCALIVYVRVLKNRTDTLDTRVDNGQTAVQGLRTDVDANTATINQHTTQINNRPTNAQAQTAINNAVNPVDTKVNTLKTRVDNATAFPIP